MTMEQMREQMKPQALKRIQTRLVLEEVVKAENLQVSDERLDEEIAKMAAAYQMEADKLKGYMSDRDKDQMKEDIAVRHSDLDNRGHICSLRHVLILQHPYNDGPEDEQVPAWCG